MTAILSAEDFSLQQEAGALMAPSPEHIESISELDKVGKILLLEAVDEKTSLDVQEPSVQLREIQEIFAPIIPLKVEQDLHVLPSVVLERKEESFLASVHAPEAQRGASKKTYINIKEVLKGAPWIYGLLLCMSIVAFALWFYEWMLTEHKRLMPRRFVQDISFLLKEGRFGDVLAKCNAEENLFGTLVKAWLSAKNEGDLVMMERMEREGKKATNALWQKLSLLSDIALIAPMIGLLGTVLGMFYAFYDVNRSLESMYTIFDGLGISVGTTVGGLFVAIIALILHSTLKYRLMQRLSLVEAKAHELVFSSKREGDVL